MKLKNSRKNVLNSKRQRASRWLQAVVEQMEPRTLLSTTVLANGVGTDIEFTGPFNNFMPVGSGASAYSGFSSFGFIDVPASAFELTSGVGGVNGVSVSLDNTATTGKFAPTAGSFAVYLIPNDTVATSVMRFGGPTGTKAGTNTDLNALGTTAGGPTALGVTGTSTADSPEFVGSFAIDTTLPSGYTTWNFPSSGFGAAVAAGIEADLNNNQDVRLAVVSLDNTGKADWAGNQSGETPQVQLDYNQAPLASFQPQQITPSAKPRSEIRPPQPSPSTAQAIRVLNPSSTGRPATEPPRRLPITPPPAASLIFSPATPAKPSPSALTTSPPLIFRAFST